MCWLGSFYINRLELFTYTLPMRTSGFFNFSRQWAKATPHGLCPNRTLRRMFFKTVGKFTIRLMDTITYSLDKKLTISTNQTDEHWEHWMISLCLCYFLHSQHENLTRYFQNKAAQVNPFMKTKMWHFIMDNWNKKCYERSEERSK